MPAWLVVADDLTGAADTGHAFATRGHSTALTLRTPPPGDADVRVVSTGSRDADPESAATAVRNAIRDTPAGAVYKKVDSTLRGNLTAELDAAIEATAAPAAAFAPAFPANGRVTACGYHLVEGRPVADTAFGDDASGAADSRLPARLAGCDHPVVPVDVSVVAAGADAVAGTVETAIEEHDRPPILACDAVHRLHLEAIAAGVRAAAPEALYAGSAGLASAIEPGGDPKPAADRPAPSGTGAVGVIGSTHPRTVEQVAAVPEDHVIPIDPAAAVRDPEGAGEAAADRAIDRLETTGRAVLTTVATATPEDRASRAADRAGIEPGTARDRIARTLAAAARRVCTRRQPRGLVLAGGAIAGATLAAIEARTVWLTDEALAAGVPVGRIAGGVADGTELVTKAGGFGDRGLITGALARFGDDP